MMTNVGRLSPYRTCLPTFLDQSVAGRRLVAAAAQPCPRNRQQRKAKKGAREPPPTYLPSRMWGVLRVGCMGGGAKEEGEDTSEPRTNMSEIEQDYSYYKNILLLLHAAAVSTSSCNMLFLHPN